MDPRLKRLLIHTIKIHPYLGHNADGEETYGEPVSYKARVEHRDRWIRGPQGDIVQTRTQVFTDLVDIKSKDKITLPNGDERTIFSVETVPGKRTDDHLVILT